MQIFICCKNAYSQGKLHGRWIVVDPTAPLELDQQIDLAIRHSPHADGSFMVLDYEGFPPGLEPKANESIQGILNLAEQVVQYHSDMRSK